MSKDEKAKDEKKEERVTILLDKETREKWEQFRETNKMQYRTISDLIRQSVNFCIDEANLISIIKDFNSFSHGLKEPLTTIKLSSQILIKTYSDKFDTKVNSMLKRIYDQTESLENKINSLIEGVGGESSLQITYDILVIEDDSEFLDVLEILFEIKGFKIKTVNSGNKGLEELKLNKPRLILLDILLPDKDGSEICKEIKNNENLKDILVYYMTAVPEVEVVEKVKNTKADGYFLKPLGDNFADEVEKLLKKKSK